ncbi:MAG: DNA mismatch repair protein MutS [Endomicrobia bacterium]|nr:DNA mismatch repair protein MutS [Endomicrobiia bacterium]
MIDNININLTPLMRQYQQIKKQYKDCILLFRLGDFYEMFGEDAIKASPVLGVVLTKRQDVPMCGVPFHSVNNYIAKLLNQGFKVAVCEQVEDPKLAKGVVKREVVRIITPGTIIEENLLNSKKNNYLLALNIIETKTYHIGIAYIDISTGDFFVTQFEDKLLLKVLDELIHISPSEVVAKVSQQDLISKIIKQYKDIHIELLDDWHFDSSTAEEKIKQMYKVYSLETFGIDSQKHTVILSAIGGLFEYLERTQKRLLPNLKPIKIYNLDNYMFLDNTCIRNLELVENLYDRTEKNTLLDVLDDTQTSLGARLLRNWLIKPLLDTKEINKRHSIVELFYLNDYLRRQIREKLKLINDIERITNRITIKTATPKDLLALKDSLIIVPELKSLMQQMIVYSQLNITDDIFSDLLNLDNTDEVVELISKSINPDAPADIKKGNVINPGYNKELDELKQFYSSSKEWLLNYQEEQRQKTGIASLKVGYNSVFGYYIEITRSNLHLVPKEYIRKQTLKNAERFTTQELKEFEDKILSAEEKILRLEEHLFNEIMEQLAGFSQKLYNLSNKIAQIDVFSNFAEIARNNNYCKPVIDDSTVIELKSSRHPVVERILPKGKFIPNDLYIDGDEIKLIIITGPNMAGKSTYIRQVALCVIMAQVGSFVPAEYARIGVVDRIFARIGAADYLAKGLSTFMVEMQETANILHNATDRSLIILDEIGRGTSTYDGISIAWSVIEHLVNKLNWHSKTRCPKTLFATHYFELTELEEKYSGIKNYNVAVKELKDEIVFLYKVQPGCSDKSYGIHVAKLAGIPQSVIKRAEVLLKYLLNSAVTVDAALDSKSQQLTLSLTDYQNFKNFFMEEILEEIEKIDINKITPLEAFDLIKQWKRLTEQNIRDRKEENIKG